MNGPTPTHDLAVIGTGIAGMAAAVFAVNRGLSVVQAGSTGALSYTSGVFDVLGALPASEDAPRRRATVVREPFKAFKALLADAPGHPYGALDAHRVARALRELCAFLAQAGLVYHDGGEHNFHVVSPGGTLKHSWCVPETVLPGCEALEAGLPCAVVGLEGLKGFSARQVAANLATAWPALTAVTMRVPGCERGELYPEQVARMLEVPAHREAFAARLKDAVGDADVAGLPAVLGMHRPGDVAAEVARLSGLRVFEIPTMPPGVPGIRLKEAFEDRLPVMGVDLCCQQTFTGELPGPDAPFRLRVTGQTVERDVSARHALLASGRFLGGGLNGDRTGIAESVFGLPVAQPAGRDGWHRQDYLDPRGHGVNRAGLETDGRFRPLGRDGRPAHERLYAAGSILAHQDWIRMKCGAGVAVATALAAVEDIAAQPR